MSLTKENIARVKGMGFLMNRGTECFSGRVVSPGGVYTAGQLKTITECAERYGEGKVIFTSRLAAEIPGIPYEKIDEACEFVAKCGLAFGGTGAKVRPVTACKGTTCVYGNIDTHKIAQELHDRFYLGMHGVSLPHKFKIGVGGCPNSCMKPSLNDLGIEGRKVFTFNEELCRGCKKCAVAAVCPNKAVTVTGGKAVIDAEKCSNCGLCVGKCPFEAVPHAGDGMCRIYAGGTWGKNIRHGTPLSRLVHEEEIPAFVEKAILWYRENGYVKERFGMTIDRVGIGAFEEAMFSDDLIRRREEILAAELKQR